VKKQYKLPKVPKWLAWISLIIVIINILLYFYVVGLMIIGNFSLTIYRLIGVIIGFIFVGIIPLYCVWFYIKTFKK